VDPKFKLEARIIANDCYWYIMYLCTDADIVSDALKKSVTKNNNSKLTKE